MRRAVVSIKRAFAIRTQSVWKHIKKNSTHSFFDFRKSIRDKHAQHYKCLLLLLLFNPTTCAQTNPTSMRQYRDMMTQVSTASHAITRAVVSRCCENDRVLFKLVCVCHPTRSTESRLYARKTHASSQLYARRGNARMLTILYYMVTAARGHQHHRKSTILFYYTICIYIY